MAQLPGSDKGGPSDALRDAIERTFEATAGTAAETRARAADLLDEVVRRSREAGEASAARLETELSSLTERLEKLESAIRAEADKRRKP
jgi:polyhydroxyalkanoate synthesis regulator phasin